MKKSGLRANVVLLVIVMIVIDQLLKFFVVKHFYIYQVQKLVPYVLSLTYLQNHGAAYSILENQQFFFLMATIPVTGGITWYLLQNIGASLWRVLGLGLIIAGSTGNFLDRLHYGFVVDMFQLEFIDFAIFNMADVYLTSGGIIVLFLLLGEENRAGKD